MLRKVTLIEGDGIGPEISEAVKHVFAAANVPVEWEPAIAGLAAIEQYGTGVTQDTLDAIKRNGLALKGPTTTPVGGGHKSVNVTIRKSLELYANVRLAKSMPAIETRYSNVDVLVFRENVEDTYAGVEHWQTANVAQCLKLITRQGSEALIRYAFDQAQTLGRKRVTCVHKANIHKITDGLWLDVFREVAKDFPDIQSDDIIVDNCCMQLVSRPEQFDVLVLPNLYGDIVSDLCAGIVGGLGVAPGGNIGHDCAVFEAVHGSAPDIAGKGVANPTALLLSGIQMLQYMGLVAHANAIMTALIDTLAAGIKTRDLGGMASTMEFAAAISERVQPIQHEATGIMAGSSAQTTHHSVASHATWELRGADVFVNAANGLPKMPEQVGPFTLKLISNRGTKVWPGKTPDILLVDHYRCRYVAESTISRSDVRALVAAIEDAGFEWMHVELLHHADGEAKYSKAQGE
ncbi:MAG: NADP-dependent isocitrate dehydrogenase [Candidatus Kapabacteria bacterium]|nr:NADP-dependent isocitrate dehydrogenase [Candidatus Kapabacteria bacterium]